MFNKGDEIVKKSLYIFFITFFLNMFLISDYNIEKVFLILAFIIIILFIKSYDVLSEIKNRHNFFIIIIIVLVSYTISLLYTFTKSYDMNFENYHQKRNDESKAVLLVYEGESQRYDYSILLRNIRLTHDIKDDIIAPIKLYRFKKQYYDIGKSDYTKKAINMSIRVNNVLASDYKVYFAFLKSKCYIEERLLQIINKGYNKIIVVPVLLTNGNKFNHLRTRVDKLKLYKSNIQIRYTEPLWDSEEIVHSYLNKLLNEINDTSTIDDTSVVLILNGEKERQFRINDKSAKQSLMFANKIKDKLIKEIGFNKMKVKISWNNYLKPNYLTIVKNMFEYGVGKILCISINPTITDLENSNIYKNINEKIDIPEGVSIKVVNGFILDDNMIDELKERIEYVSIQNWN